MTSPTPQPVTAQVFLLGHRPDAGRAVAASLKRHRVLTSVAAVGGLSRAGLQAVGRETSGIVSGLLDVNLADVMLGGWRKHAALTAAARRTRAAPGSRELVELATHRITSTHRPCIELLVDGHLVATLRLELTIELTIKALVAGVAHGDLVALHAGQCVTSGALSIEGHEVARRQAEIDLRAVLPLSQAIPLLPAQPTPDVPPPPPVGQPLTRTR